jgi:uncharacterized protein DUF4410
MRRYLWLLLGMTLVGCGATRSSPDNVTSAGGLKPSVEDRAGLVAVAPGLAITKYKIIVVEKLLVAAPEIQDDGDRRFGAKMSDYLHRQLLRRLRESGLFQQVIDGGESAVKPNDAPALRLNGAITRLGRGSQAARVFAGLYGAGRTRAQTETRFIDVASDSVVIATADRRISSYNPWTFGGSDEANLEESFDDIARDLADFLVRLSRGESPKK